MGTTKKSKPSESNRSSWLLGDQVLPTPNTDESKRLRQIYWGSLIAMGVFMVLLAINSGLNADEEFQYDYSSKLVDYYSSMGADEAALYIEKGNMHYYGGFFDTVTGFVNKILGFEQTETGYRTIRHLFMALFGWLAIFFTAQFSRSVGGIRAAIITAVLLFLSPRFLGHAMMNPKDIPFAMGNIMAVYFMFQAFRSWNQISWKTVAGIAGGIGIALATRAGGILLLAYMGLFTLVFLFISNRLKGQKLEWGAVFRGPILKLAVAAVGGYVLAVIFWPFALSAPIEGPKEALTEFSKLGISIRVLFGGANIMSDQTAVSYAAQWILMTIPPAVILGFALSVGFYKSFVQKYSFLASFMLVFCALFPVLYVMYKDSTLHDGWRHLIFMYPTLVAVAALSFDLLLDKFQNNKTLSMATLGVLVLLTINPARYIVMNYDYPYTYFNLLVGGVNGAFGQYETDYWGVSVKQAIEEMDKRGYFPEGDTVMVVSHFSYSLQKYIQNKYNGRVKTGYVRYYQRYNKDWDYGIFPTRYIGAGLLNSGNWPDSRSLFTIDADGIPLLSVDQGGGAIFAGERALAAADYVNAAKYYTEEIQKYPDNTFALLGLTRSNLALNNWEDAIKYADDYIRLVPDYTQAYLFKGNAMMNAGRLSEAVQVFQYILRLDPNYLDAYYYMAYSYLRIGDNNNALVAIQNFINRAPNNANGFLMAADIYKAMGNNQAASDMLGRAANLR